MIAALLARGLPLAGLAGMAGGLLVARAGLEPNLALAWIVPLLASAAVGVLLWGALERDLGRRRALGQLDALATLAIDPVRQLVLPRIAASALAVPLAVLLADAVAFGVALAAGVAPPALTAVPLVPVLALAALGGALAGARCLWLDELPRSGTRAGTAPAGLRRGDLPVHVRGLRGRGLRGVDLEVAPGEAVAVVGAAGAGKTRLMRALLGLEESEGSARLFGMRPRELGRADRARLWSRVGVVLEGGALFDDLRVEQNVGLALAKAQRLPADEVERLVRESLLLVGLKHVEHLRIAQLAPGARRRVALARAIAHRPELLVVDALTAGLDPVAADALGRLLAQLRERLGLTLLATHADPRAAAVFADRIALLHGGRLVTSVDASALDASVHPALRQLVRGHPYGPVAA